MFVQSLNDSGNWIDRVAALMERRAPVLLKSADVCDYTTPRHRGITPATHEKIRQLYAASKAQGRRVRIEPIASKCGVNRATVVRHTRDLR